MKLYVTLITAALGVGLIIAVASSQKAVDYAEMVEDLQVMCRIVDDTMQENFEKEYVRSGFFGRRGCQELYLKGYGVVFLLDFQFPVTDKELKVVKTERKTDLWDKYEREVRHQSAPQDVRWVTDKNEAYDAGKVDKLKEKLAYLAGEYGSRINQLESDDVISFVVFGRAGHASWESGHVFNWSSDHNVHFEDGVVIHTQVKEEKAKAEHKVEQSRVVTPSAVPQLPAVIAPGHVSVRTFGPHGRPVTTLILTFNRSMLKGKKGSDWEALLRSADIVQY